MKRLSFFLIISLISVFLLSCSTPNYFYDPSSKERQKELRSTRSANVWSDIILSFSSACISAAFDTEIGYIPQEQKFKKLNLVNTTSDTMYVNMLTDVFWDESNYCDFMDIRIPPKLNCKVMVPLDATYNLYFSTTPEENDDEMIEISTSSFKRISLKPGMTILTEIDEGK
ncbi:MAG TPA: hypothetical protein PK335_08440 [Draconibacterium sp.]|nr:hypothetical protein [Draconibacterium sp.]